MGYRQAAIYTSNLVACTSYAHRDCLVLSGPQPKTWKSRISLNPLNLRSKQGLYLVSHTGKPKQMKLLSGPPAKSGGLSRGVGSDTSDPIRVFEIGISCFILDLAGNGHC